MSVQIPLENLQYRRLVWLDLLALIVEKADRAALDEFHGARRPIRGFDGRTMALVEYVYELAEERLGERQTRDRLSEFELDRARDLTIDRFLNLPDGEYPIDQQDGFEGMARAEAKTDCRRYFTPFLKKLSEIERMRPAMSRVEKEIAASTLLKRQVKRHFEFCLKEARRLSNPFVSRYEWKTKSGSIYVMFPKEFPGRQRKAWLENNVEDPDSGRAGERERVQRIIDARLPQRRFVEFEEDTVALSSAMSRDRLESWAFLYGFTAEGLAAVVAEEKASQIRRQRPAIRSIGPKHLRRLVLEVFDNLEEPRGSDCGIATRYGLSKASFSRFAGTRWQERFGEDHQARIPDLWLNTARALSNHPHFAEAAKDAGVWPRVTDVLTRDSGKRSPNDA